MLHSTSRLTCWLFAALCLAAFAAAGQQPSEAPEDSALRGMKLLPGYRLIQEQGIDSAVGRIVRGTRTVVEYDIGPMAGIHIDRAHKKQCKKYEEKKVDGRTMRICLTGKKFAVTFPDAYANFFGEAQDDKELAQVIEMLKTLRWPR